MGLKAVAIFESGGGGGGGPYTTITSVPAFTVLGNNTGSTHNAIAITYASSDTNSSIVSRDTNGNSAFNNAVTATSTTVSSGQTVSMSAGSTGNQVVTGTANITFNLPDATTLYLGQQYEINVNTTGTATIYKHDGSTLVATAASGTYLVVICTNNSTSNGAWDYHWELPSSSGGKISPGGSNTQIQRNNSGAFAGTPRLLDDGTHLAIPGGTALYLDGLSDQTWGIGLSAFPMTSSHLSSNALQIATDSALNGYGVAIGSYNGDAALQVDSVQNTVWTTNLTVPSSAVFTGTFHTAPGVFAGFNHTSPVAHVDTISTQLTTGNPAAGSISFTTGNVTGYTAQTDGTVYTYHVYNSQVLNGITVYSATPAAFSVTQNIEPTSPTYTANEIVTGYNYGVTENYTIYSTFSDGTRSSSGVTISATIDATPTGVTANQSPLGPGTGYTASGQSEYYTIYPLFLGLRASSGAPTYVTFDTSFSQVQVNIGWANNTHLTPDQWLIVNTTTNTSTTVPGYVTGVDDTADWSAYSDPGTVIEPFQINLNWLAPGHGASSYLVHNTSNNSAQATGATGISDTGAWSPWSDPGVTLLDFSLNWSNGSGATDTLVQSSLKPSNTYDFAGLPTTLNDDSTGWGSPVNTTSPTFALDDAFLSDGLSITKNTSGNTTTPLNSYAPTGGGDSQQWYDSSGNPQGYVNSSGQFNGGFNGSFYGSLSGSQSGGSVNSNGFTNSGSFSNTTNNSAAQFVTTGLNGSNHEYGNISTYAKTNTASNDFGGGWIMYAQDDAGTSQPQAGIFGAWAQAHDATYNGRLYIGTYSASNSNNFKEFVRMQMETTNSDNVPQTAWGVDVVQFVSNNFGTGGQEYTGIRVTAQGTPDTDLFQIADNGAVIRAHIDQTYGNWAANQYAADTSSLGSEKITNGTFTGSASSWTLNTGWTYSSNAVHKSADGTGTLLQTSASMATPLVVGQMYQLQYTMSSWTVGTVTPSCGGVTMKTDNGAFTNGNTQTRYFRATSTADLTFTPSNTARFALDNISLKQITAGDVDAAANVYVGTNLNIADAGNVVVGTSTGTKIGTATSQKLGFYNSTPVVQQNTTGTTTGYTGNTSANILYNESTFTGGSGSTAYRVSDIVLALKNLGLLAT